MVLRHESILNAYVYTVKAISVLFITSAYSLTTLEFTNPIALIGDSTEAICKSTDVSSFADVSLAQFLVGDEVTYQASGDCVGGVTLQLDFGMAGRMNLTGDGRIAFVWKNLMQSDSGKAYSCRLFNCDRPIIPFQPDRSSSLTVIEPPQSVSIAPKSIAAFENTEFRASLNCLANAGYPGGSLTIYRIPAGSRDNFTNYQLLPAVITELEDPSSFDGSYQIVETFTRKNNGDSYICMAHNLLNSKAEPKYAEATVEVQYYEKQISVSVDSSEMMLTALLNNEYQIAVKGGVSGTVTCRIDAIPKVLVTAQEVVTAPQNVAKITSAVSEARIDIVPYYDGAKFSVVCSARYSSTSRPSEVHFYNATLNFNITKEDKTDLQLTTVSMATKSGGDDLTWIIVGSLMGVLLVLIIVLLLLWYLKRRNNTKTNRSRPVVELNIAAGPAQSVGSGYGDSLSTVEQTAGGNSGSRTRSQSKPESALSSSSPSNMEELPADLIYLAGIPRSRRPVVDMHAQSIFEYLAETVSRGLQPHSERSFLPQKFIAANTEARNPVGEIRTVKISEPQTC